MPPVLGLFQTVLLALSAFSTSAVARVWHVNVNGTGDVPTIVAAVVAAADGDTIVVGPGHYDEGITVADPFVKSLEIRSSHGSRLTSVRSIAALERGSAGDQRVSFTGFTAEDKGGPAEYAGVRIIGIASVHLEECVIRGFRRSSLFENVDSISVVQCTFEEIENERGSSLGGGAVEIHATNGSRISILDCVFRRNRSYYGSPGEGWGGGGAIALDANGDGVDATIRHCVFDGNSAVSAGAVFVTGNVTLSHNTFLSNLADDAALVVVLNRSPPVWGDHWRTRRTVHASPHAQNELGKGQVTVS